VSQEYIASDSQVPTAVLVDGFHAARIRFLGSEPNTPASFHAAVESVAWAGVLRDRFKAERRVIPALLNGLWYARNVVLHRGVDALHWLIIFPGTYPAKDLYPGPSLFPGDRVVEWTWRPREELGPRRTGRLRQDESDYDAHVAGRSVREVFDELFAMV
jgi:hypothetical protein